MKRKLLIINQTQFGYHSDSYYWTKYLQDLFELTYICWDYNHKKIELKGVTIIYISRNGNIAVRNLRFIFYVLKELKNGYSFHIIKYFRGCSILKILNLSKKFLFDIRTGSVNKKKINRFVYDFLMKTEAKFFKYVSVISKSLAQKLGLSKKAYILPLGADIISDSNKIFNSIDLLYVGTLSNRNIEQTIKGFSRFYHEYKDIIRISYTIIGSGYNNEEDELKELIRSETLSDSIVLTGQIPHNKLKIYFDECNIGVSYIPVTDYFDVQPPTKTFEYLLSGMPVIATNTQENIAVINKENGVLSDDDSLSFYHCLRKIHTKKKQYQSETIKQQSLKYTWHNIVSDLNCYIKKII